MNVFILVKYNGHEVKLYYTFLYFISLEGRCGPFVFNGEAPLPPDVFDCSLPVMGNYFPLVIWPVNQVVVTLTQCLLESSL